MKWSEMSKKKKNWLIVIAVLLVLAVIGNFAPDNNNTVLDTPKEYYDLSSFVQVTADIYLKPQLKYPDGWEYENKSVQRAIS